jgi:hypothetical protein
MGAQQSQAVGEHVFKNVQIAHQQQKINQQLSSAIVSSLKKPPSTQNLVTPPPPAAVQNAGQGPRDTAKDQLFRENEAGFTQREQ